ncbi:MAG TPA: cation acetate symporter [Gaiellales bacterium]|nr:cation acetate symporter [Gaiellales bacterium]
MIALAMVAAVVLFAGGLSVSGVRVARTTSDLFVASRSVSTWWNAGAISGEYLSAASFLGIAGLTMQIGAGALWQAVGFAAGYLALLLFVAAPLRRYGSYTIADFAESRLESPALRLISSSVVLAIAALYLIPQLKGAGITLAEVTAAPYWVGVATVGVIVTLGVSMGGMHGITYVQAFLFWIKLTAIAVPVLLIAVHLGGLPTGPSLFGNAYPRAPAAGAQVRLAAPTQVRFPAASAYTDDAGSFRVPAGAARTLPAGTVRFAAGAVLPAGPGVTARPGNQWARPVTTSGESSPVFLYSLLLATFLGTMGLPHILVRFYTNADGPAARRTTVSVLSLLGVFYLFPGIYGLLGRAFTPGLYVSGQTDAVVLSVPRAAWPGLPGEVLGGVVAAGAFAAFMSTSSGLLVSIAGTLSYDMWPRLRRGRGGTMRTRRLHFRLAAPVGVIVPVVMALSAQSLDISVLVGWAFALAASTCCPLFLLGIWWGRLTAPGAIAGMLFGGLVATSAIVLDLAQVTAPGAVGALLAQPAAVSVPLAFSTMVLVSLLRPGRIDGTDRQALALHGPEELGFDVALRDHNARAQAAAG